MCVLLLWRWLKKAVVGVDVGSLITDGVERMNTRLENARTMPIPRAWIMPTFVFALSAVAAVPDNDANVGNQLPDAAAVLARMADLMSNTRCMSVTVHAAYDAVQSDGLKVEWNEIRKVTLKRPDLLRVDGERSDGDRSLILFDGKNITTFDESAKVYARAPQTGDVDQTVIHFVKDMGMRLPLAVLLLSSLPEELQSRVQRLEYVEKTTTLSQPAHHLVGQTATVDFQLWIADGEQPLPLRAVLTYKNAPGQPQFRAEFSDWDLTSDPPDSLFAFTPPAQATQIPFASALQQVVLGSKGAAKKGTKK